MITVRFYGRLKDDFGGRFVLDAASPREALHALFVQLDGLRDAVRQGFYRVRWRGKTVSEAQAETVLSEQCGGCLEITPVAAGAGRAGQIIAGIVLVVIGVVITVVTDGAASAIAEPMIVAGIGMIVGGVAQLLTKQPKMETDSHGMKSGRNSSFSNLDNTAAQGRPVPLAYGRVYCGSRVISQGVESRRLNSAAEDGTGGQPAGDPTMTTALHVEKTFHGGEAALSADGVPFDTDFADDSVRARNYTAVLKE